MLAARCDKQRNAANREDHAPPTGAGQLRAADHSRDPDEVVRRLRELLARRRYRQAHRPGRHRQFIPTGLARLDVVLPSGGLPCGAVSEILTPGPGLGAFSLALRIARQALQPPEQAQSVDASGTGARLVIVDTTADLYPPAVSAFGIEIDRLIVLRVPERGRMREEALWAVDQALRCRAVATVIAPISQLDERQSRRFQLAAEQGGGIALLLRPARPRGKSFAAVRILIEGGCPTVASEIDSNSRASPEEEDLREPYWARLTLLSVREGRPAEPFWVDLHHETGAVPLLSLPDLRAPRKLG